MYYLLLISRNFEQPELKAFIENAKKTGLIVCNDGTTVHELHAVSSWQVYSEVEFGIRVVEGEELDLLVKDLRTFISNSNPETGFEILYSFAINTTPVHQETSEGYR